MPLNAKSPALLQLLVATQTRQGWERKLRVRKVRFVNLGLGVNSAHYREE